MKPHFLGKLFLALCFLCCTPLVFSKDLSHVHVSLLTVGVGPTLDSRFGHTILRILDESTGEDHLYNWGTFSFDDPNFYTNFVRGKLRYWLADEDFDGVLYQYGFYYKREVVQDRLLLTDRQKERLLSRIAVNMESENRHFWYDFFFYNCSTIPRDYLDEVMDGKLKQAWVGKPSSKSFRGYVRDHLNTPPIVAFGLEILLNGSVDRPITAWDEMFYPPKLREYLAATPAFDDQGQQIAPSLFQTSEVLVHGHKYPPSSLDLFPFVSLLGGFLFFLCILTWWRKGLPWRLSVAALALFWGLLAFVFGSLMILGWAFSSHRLLHYNANLILFWPLDIWLGVLAIYYVRKGSLSPIWQKALRMYIYSHFGWALLFIGAYAAGLVHQDVHASLIYLLPVAALAWVSLLQMGTRST